MKYIVVRAGALVDLEVEVTEKLKEGFKLVGGLTMERVNSSSMDIWTLYMQAMLKENDVPVDASLESLTHWRQARRDV